MRQVVSGDEGHPIEGRVLIDDPSFDPRQPPEIGSARAVMGNHELNAIGWASRDPADEALHLRPRHGPKGEENRRQHDAFLSEVGGDTDLHREWVDWFLELPLWIETPTYRVVHACWEPAAADVVRPHLRSGERLDPGQLHRAYRRDDPVGAAIDVLLKGPEVALPRACSFVDKDGHRRTEIRTRWWEPNARTYREAYIGPDGVDIPNLPLPSTTIIPEPDRPTFIGHYWLSPSQPPAPLALRVACVDYSVAKGGPLVAYRFEGETELRAEVFVGVPTAAKTALAG